MLKKLKELKKLGNYNGCKEIKEQQHILKKLKHQCSK